MRKKRQRKRIPLSGDLLVDGLFIILVDALERDIRAIHMKDDLRDPSNRKQKIYGLSYRDERRIFIGKEKHRRTNEPVVKTLVHELLHQVLPKTRHIRIYRLERDIWPRITDSQKRFLRRYIPKHTVKREPES